MQNQIAPDLDKPARTYSRGDLTVATSCLLIPALVIAALAGGGALSVCAGSAGLAAVLAAAQRVRELRKGARSLCDLSVIARDYQQWVLSGLAMSLVMPALFPSTAYTTQPWLIHFNAALFEVSVFMIPAARLISHVVVWRAAQRSARSERK